MTEKVNTYFWRINKMFDNKLTKLKNFAEKHELAIAIAGGAVICVASAGLMYLGYRSVTNISMKDLKRIAGKDKNVGSLIAISDCLKRGTAGHTIARSTVPVTIAEYFGDYAEEFMKGSKYQSDDIIVDIIYNIAKKAET